MLVVAMLLCPSTSCTTLVWTPFSSNRVAYPCRRLWGVIKAAVEGRLPHGIGAARWFDAL